MITMKVRSKLNQLSVNYRSIREMAQYHYSASHVIFNIMAEYIIVSKAARMKIDMNLGSLYGESVNSVLMDNHPGIYHIRYANDPNLFIKNESGVNLTMFSEREEPMAVEKFIWRRRNGYGLMLVDIDTKFTFALTLKGKIAWIRTHTQNQSYWMKSTCIRYFAT